MVVFDSQNGGCSIYEIKYNMNVNEKQFRHLVDKEKAMKTEFYFGEIHGRYVLYRGESTKIDSIQYLNVEEYLKSIAE